MKMRAKHISAIVLGICLEVSHAKSLWSRRPAGFGPEDSEDYLLKTGYPVGNGKLGAISFGAPASEKLSLNVDSLWSGGPFENSSYTGGNPTTPKYQALADIRATIFQNGTGDLTPLLGTGQNYGSNRVLGNMTIAIPELESYDNYTRILDLKTGVHTTQFTSKGASFTTSLFCSYPDQVCVYHIESTDALPTITVGFENLLVPQTLIKVACDGNSTRLTGFTNGGDPQGMKYSAIARSLDNSATTSCSNSSSLVILSSNAQKSQTIIIAAETDYDQKKGNRDAGYSFKGQDPEPIISKIASQAASKEYNALLANHLSDYQALEGAFTLDLPDPNHSSAIETATLISNYNWTLAAGDPFLESLLFDYSRYLLISSSRENSLPANLQGRWTERLDSAWGADYHTNINLQMNYWGAEQTGLGGLGDALWNYMLDTWVPRGTETARLLYGAAGGGWVVHNEVNIFGHTAMKEDALWADYPAAGAWMMQHVWDHFDYTQDIPWLRSQGYPLLKGVAEFWLSQLREDAFSHDATLVANPCNSPEIGPTTFGCAHYQQLIRQVFDNVLAAGAALSFSNSLDGQGEGGEEEGERGGKAEGEGEGEGEAEFLARVQDSLARLDNGIHIAEWGGLKEWKLPSSSAPTSIPDFDEPSTHRHLSHLAGWYPGYSISSYSHGYSLNTTIQDAVRATLISRGLGTADDADAGWAKVWRAACWARLNETSLAYKELRYAVDVNFAGNGLSMYGALNPPFQIDANFGVAGAVTSMLVVDLPVAAFEGSEKGEGKGGKERVVVLGPAIPPAWGGGRVSGLRVRGGAVVDFGWDADGVVVDAVAVATMGSKSKEGGGVVFVNVRGDVLCRI